MKKLALIGVIALAFSTTAMAVEIAISTQANWWTQGAADREMQEIVDNVSDVPVLLFPANEQNALADWVVANTGDGESDILILCGQLPDTIYAPGNSQADNSLIELFLDDGNCIINTGDWMFYVTNGTTANGSAGMVTIMDLDTMAGRWDDNVPVTVTDEGRLYCPSLVNFTTDRALHMDVLDENWEAELSLALAADGVRADPGVVRNKVTGGRIGVFYEVANEDNLPRGEVISEWINNWYLVEAVDLAVATTPRPTEGAVDVLRDATLSWKANRNAVAHDVYLGTDFDDVNNATRTSPMGLLVSQGQAEASYDASTVYAYGQTYYWRIDEVRADGSINKGTVWTFTAETFARPIENVIATSNTRSTEPQTPARLVDGSGLHDADQHSINTDHMWSGAPNPGEPPYVQFEFDGSYKLHELLVWNYNMQWEIVLGYGLKSVTLEYSQDGADWTVLGDYELAQASGQATNSYDTIVPLEGVSAKYVRLTINSNFGGTQQAYGLSEVRFLAVPVLASEPQPANGATGVTIDSSLNWRTGREAASHEIYMGTDPNALVLDGTTTDTTYTPTVIDLDTTVYWQVVEVNNTETPSTWAGDVWSFTTEEYIEIDGFESYNDDTDAGTAIFQTWLDGYEDSTNGNSFVGNDPSPFAEQTIVHRGGQSMPFYFDNGSASAIAETDRKFSPAENWTVGGIKTLTLWFYGATGNTGTLYVKINNTKVVYNGDASDISKLQWQPWNIDLASAGANLSNVTSISIGVQGTGSGTLYIDDVRLYAKTAQYVTPGTLETTDLVAHYTLDGNANDSSGHGYNGTETGGFLYVNGVNGQALDTDGASGYVDITNATDWPAGAEPRSMAAWLMTRNAGSGARFAVSYGTGATGQAMFIGMIGPTIYGGGYGDDITVGNFFVADEWYHTCLTYDGTTAILYANGQEIVSGERAWNLQLDRAHIGQQVNNLSEFWDGAVDDVYIYSRVLSPEEVAGMAGRTNTVNVPF